MKRHIFCRTCPRVHSFGKFPMRHGSVASIKPTVENRSEIDFQENIFRQNIINDLQNVKNTITNPFNMSTGMSSPSDHFSTIPSTISDVLRVPFRPILLYELLLNQS